MQTLCDTLLYHNPPFRPAQHVVAFTTYRGGEHTNPYYPYNCGPYCGDDPAHVQSNLQHLRQCFPQATEWVLPYQTHGHRIMTVDAHYLTLPPDEKAAQCHGVDGLLTPLPHVCLCIGTADCVPILLFDPIRRVVGAFHAGWRGTVQHIVSHGLTQMEQQFATIPAHVTAYIGPSICQDAFEVGDEVYEAFRIAGFDMEVIASRTDKWHIDLAKANIALLRKAGVRPQAIHGCDHCTYHEPALFFSARRMGIHSGRMLTGIMLTK